MWYRQRHNAVSTTTKWQKLVTCGVRPSLKGSIYKALAACAKDPETARRIWIFIEEAQQLVPTGTGRQEGVIVGGGIGKNASSSSNSQPRGLFAEMEQVESRERTYPVTEGFCCLIQELVQHDLPYNLGEKTRYRGASGIQPYVAYLLKCVLIPELRFADAGERWRVAARVLQVMLTLLRRYPLTGEGGGANPGPSSMATPEDEEACRLDFDPKASSSSSSSSSQRRYKSPGYYILREILGQGGLFRQMVQVLKGPGRHGDGGVAGLRAARVKAAASTALKQGLMLPGGRKSEADGGSLAAADRYIACVS
ncbi:unnamed protein product [Ectocarpus sp. 12 AP-2014]